MNLNSSLLNCSRQSFCTESVLGESTRSNYVSNLELSQITTSHSNLSITIYEEEKNLRRKVGKSGEDDSLMNITQPKNGPKPTTAGLGSKNVPSTTVTEVTKVTEVTENKEGSVIPLDEEDDDVEEVSILENAQDTITSQPNNGTLPTTVDFELKNDTTKVTEVKMITEGAESEKGERVIPVDEEDDDVEEVSILEKTQDTSTSVQSDMFSHLQPKKTTAEIEQLQNAVEDKEMPDNELDTSHIAEFTMDHESLQFIPTETDLFQYPFIEVGRRLWPSNEYQQNYAKGCLWSPDGTCLLVPVHLDGMHIVELPTDLYTLGVLNAERDISDLASAVHVKEGGTVYDCCWYPYMNSSDSVTCCWLATRQHEPIHMWDAFSGELRCSYRGYDDVDEVESAISIVFTNDALKVIGGYKKTIKIFDTAIPGRDCFTIPVKNAVSCFALTTDNDHCVTAGTWSGYINHYDLRAPKLGSLFTLGGHTGGITWLKYSPIEDHSWYLFSGARKDNKILQWDMRNYREPVQIFIRNVQTNQRIYYDLSPLHKWLASGDTEGLLRIWNLDNQEQQLEIPLHADCCNGVSFHPSLPIICTTSGQYHFVDVTEDENSKNVDETEEKIIDYENSLLFLWYGHSEEQD